MVIVLPMLRTINASQMRLINRSAVLEYLRLHSPASRTEISEKLDVSMPTVMRIVDKLIEDNLVISGGEVQEGMGRKRGLIEFNKDAYSVIGIDLGGTKMFGALANIGGEILHEVALELHGTTGEESYRALKSLVRELLIKGKKAPPIKGIAVGAPGVTRGKEGIIEWAPALQWREYPLKEKLEKDFDLPCFVDNDVNLATLGEQWFGLARGLGNVMLISIGTGVGGGLILDGGLFRGSTSASGEIGYWLSDFSDLGKSYDGFGALESRISGTGILEMGQEKLSALGIEDPKLTTKKIFKQAALGEVWAQEVLEEVADYLSLTIANINALLDLDMIVLSGGVSNSAGVLMEKIKSRIKGTTPRMPDIRISTLRRKAAVMGAIVMVVQAVDDYVFVRSFS